jgi:hypothetical protein
MLIALPHGQEKAWVAIKEEVLKEQGPLFAEDSVKRLT